MKKKYAVVVFLAVMGLVKTSLAADQEAAAASPPEGQSSQPTAQASSPAAAVTPEQSKAAGDATAAGAPAAQEQAPSAEHQAAPAAAPPQEQPQTGAGQSAATAKEQPSSAAGAGEVVGVTAAIKELLDTLVEQGVLKQDKAGELLQKMEERLRAEPLSKRPPPPADPNVVGVPYVPEFVKDDIIKRMSPELRAEILQDVLVQAKEERWGLPDVIPWYLRFLKWSGDIRVRAQGDMFANDNAQNFYLDFQKVNSAGGIGKTDNPFLNTSIDRYRMRLRARLAMDAEISDNVNAKMRITTGNSLDPISTNQTLTLGNTGGRYQAVWDEAYLRYEGLSGYTKLTLWGGRMPDPWMHTDLVWDDDLGFDGVAASLNYNLFGLFKPDSSEAPERSVFVTAGAFPIQEVELSSSDKWLYGAQMGTHWEMADQSQIKMGLAYYDFTHITGSVNTLDSKLLDFTAPQSVVKGNTMFDIRNDADPNTNLFALVSDYNMVNFTASMDFPQFVPIDVIVTADYVKNIGFDQQKVFERTGVQVKPRTQGYQLMVAVGKKEIAIHGDWKVTAAFKHLERDAVVDAFTDSDFHLGGTDAEGWTLQYDYGLTKQTWFTARWLSSDAIDGPPLGIDTLQLDVSAKF